MAWLREIHRSGKTKLLSSPRPIVQQLLPASDTYRLPDSVRSIKWGTVREFTTG